MENRASRGSLKCFCVVERRPPQKAAAATKRDSRRAVRNFGAGPSESEVCTYGARDGSIVDPALARWTKFCRASGAGDMNRRPPQKPGRYKAASHSRWFGVDVSWFDEEKLGWRLGFE